MELNATAGVTGDDALDPVTFEVIRHRLWSINDDQGKMAARLSGSSIVYEGYDLNAALVTADGRGLYCGVYILHHGATIDSFVRRVLEDWPAEEIREGDMFFTNDPWWGALHANDGIMVMPIFWEGRLVAWSGVAMHDDDVGSAVPGSFVAHARDRFEEAPLFPGIKMVENFEPRADVERAFLRNSRTPELNTLNIRARMGALRSTYSRITDLIEQYGLTAFLAAQDRIVDHVETVVADRLRSIPDGSWSAEVFHAHREDEVYRFSCTLIKRGAGLTIDLTGTSAQAPAPINCARPAMEGALMGAILPLLCYDLPWSIAGLRRLTTIVSEEGTINNATDPAAMSMASVMGTLFTQDVAVLALAKMLLSSSEHREEAQATWSPGVTIAGLIATDEDGVPLLGTLADSFGGGGGARASADGIDSSGIFHAMGARIQNIEVMESRCPSLMLYRRELEDSGGAGRFRGGNSIEIAGVTHNVPRPPALVFTMGSGLLAPAGRGVAGGLPGAAASNMVFRGTDIREQFARHRIPRSSTEVVAGAVDFHTISTVAPLLDGDIYFGRQPSGSGLGDPLRRDPERVAQDVYDGSVSEAAARALYGVALDDGGECVASAQTESLREAMRQERLAESRPVAEGVGGGTYAGGAILHGVSDSVEAVLTEDGRRIQRCNVCAQVLSDYDQDYKQGTLVRDRPLTAANRHNDRCLPTFVLREFVCPGCATLLVADVQPAGAPVSSEVRFGDGADSTEPTRVVPT